MSFHNLAQDAIDIIESRVAKDNEPYQIAEVFLDQIIARVRQRFGGTYSETALLFADLKAEHGDTLYAEMHDHLHVDDAVDAIHQIFAD